MLGEDWQDSPETNRALLLLLLVLTVSLIFIFNSYPGQAKAAEIYIFFAFFAGLLFLAGQLMEGNPLVRAAGLGDSFGRLFIALFFGIGAGFLLTGMKFTIATLALASPAAFFEQLFVVFVAPAIEEIFFRGTLFFTLALLLQKYEPNGILAAILVSLAFGFFHIFVGAGAGLSQDMIIITSGLFSLIAIVGNRVTNSLGFGLGVHWIINTMLFFR